MMVDWRVETDKGLVTFIGIVTRSTMCVSRFPSLYTTLMASYGLRAGFGTADSPTSYGAPRDRLRMFCAALLACSCVVMNDDE